MSLQTRLNCWTKQSVWNLPFIVGKFCSQDSKRSLWSCRVTFKNSQTKWNKMWVLADVEGVCCVESEASSCYWSQRVDLKWFKPLGEGDETMRMSRSGVQAEHTDPHLCLPPEKKIVPLILSKEVRCFSALYPNNTPHLQKFPRMCSWKSVSITSPYTGIWSLCLGFPLPAILTNFIIFFKCFNLEEHLGI